MHIIVLDTDDHELLPICWRTVMLLNSTSKQLDYMLYWEIENCGFYFKKEVNQKKEIERKGALWWRCDEWSFVVDYHFQGDDDDWLFLRNGWPTKVVLRLTSSRDHCNANLRHAASRVWTCVESEFRLYWMKLCSSNNHYIKQEGVNLSHFFP